MRLIQWYLAEFGTELLTGPWTGPGFHTGFFEKGLGGGGVTSDAPRKQCLLLMF